MSSESNPRLISFYLPQFHPIPENDEWWGKGFTEWTNVTRAKKKFRGHYQPHLPADLGFYDLRSPEIRAAQAELAAAYGISGFCYYHYWFNGRRLLERPFSEVLTSGKPDFPFCLCWANENWTRIWDGGSKNILVEQHYCESDDRRHMQCLSEAFKDPRYIRVQGKPIFLVYRAGRIPDPCLTTSVWRDEARKQGVGEILLCRVESFSDEHGDPRDIGFDASVEFQPNWQLLPTPFFHRRRLRWLRITDIRRFSNRIWNYSTLAKAAMSQTPPPYPRFPGITPMWDNSARRAKGAHILKDSTPALYEEWLKTILKRLRAEPSSDQIVFINAWNEWAEGCHLEPCMKWGRQYLEATKFALQSQRQK